MKVRDGKLTASPTDLTNFLACPHASRLDVDVALGRDAPRPGRDPDAELLAELGRRHEQAYLDQLRADGRSVINVGPGLTDEAELAALLHEGPDVLAQVPLRKGDLHGVADVLRRVERPSELGGHAYEVQDTKLSRATKGATVLQLMTYADALGDLQGTPGEHVHAVAPGPSDAVPFTVDTLRVSDFAAVTRHAHQVFQAFLETAQAGRAETAPEPVEHCAVCRWWEACRAHWRKADHLSLVANLGGAHRAELGRNGIDTRRALAREHGGLSFRPAFGSRDAYLAAAHQADTQVRSEDEGKVVVDDLATDPDKGLHLLPVPSPHDVYLDLEGTPFFDRHGIEYLWGWAGPEGAVTHHWATDSRSEWLAFERFIDHATQVRRDHPEAHVYHYGSYEPSALKRLMGQYGTREEELDALLRSKTFVDLHAVTRQAFRIGVESYSLKDLERVHGFSRQADLRSLGPFKREVEHAIILRVPQGASEEASGEVATYNADDVRSTRALHRWLERQRERQGITARPDDPSGQPSENLADARDAATEVKERLAAHLPDDPATWSDDDHAHALLADLIDFERREDKVDFWEKFSLQDATDEELEDSPKGLVGLQFVETVATSKTGIPTNRYRHPPQDVDRRGREDFYVWAGEGYSGLKVEGHDQAEHTIDLKHSKLTAHLRPTRGFFWSHVPSDMIAAARLELANDILDRGLEADGPYRAARDLLLRRAGRAGAPLFPVPADEDPVTATARIASALDGGVLPVQGPPGSGKTYTAARVILELVRQGRTVGVTAVSNPAIAKLLQEVAAVAAEQGHDVRIAKKVRKDEKALFDVPGVEAISEYEVIRTRLGDRLDVVGGTAWLWSRPDFRSSIDTLVIDEAGQFSLATALSVATSARDVLLFGDPQQLAQPIRATHPDGADVSCLEHFLDGHRTIPRGRGLFIETTRRMAPSLTRVVSELFYESRLSAAEENERIRLSGTDGFDGTGFRFVPVDHEGRDGYAPEEVDAVARLVPRLLTATARFHDRHGTGHDLTPADVLVVAPFNRQVDALKRALPGTIEVGTVDRFQGQEGAVVIYTLGVSTQDLAPRGLSFLFDAHRANVALSRAKARAILIAAPRLFNELPATPDGLKLLNAHLRIIEEAEPLSTMMS